AADIAYGEAAAAAAAAPPPPPPQHQQQHQVPPHIPQHQQFSDYELGIVATQNDLHWRMDWGLPHFSPPLM
ncbi:hypothetical protein A2U01_0111346, partial [Trifolium medium]|nr:hypothetical protein [Trifolium medium]